MKVLEAAARAIRHGRKAALCTVIGFRGSTPRSQARMLVYEDGSIEGTIGGGAVELAVMHAALDAMERGRSVRWSADLTRDLGMCCGGQMEVFVEPLVNRERFFCLGAGHVAHALVPVLAALDFEVVVVDERDELLTEERFPGVRRVLEDPRLFLASVDHQPEDFVLVVTHDHALDQDLVEHLLAVDLAWLGMIGSQGKVARFLVRFRAAGVPVDTLRRLSAPVGLDIGAETPAEIAVSIAAEVVRVRRRSHGPTQPLSEQPLEARGGDGKAVAPRMSQD